MELLAIVALLGFVAWLIFRPRPGSSAVALSALNAVREWDAQVIGAWRNLEAAIEATEDPRSTCARMLEMRRAELPAKIDELWRYIDDITEKGNVCVRHYETVSRLPAPPAAGRAESKRVMARIRHLAAQSAR